MAAEAALLALMSRHTDFLRAGETWRFTLCAFGAGAAFWLAASAFSRDSPLASRRQFWAVAILLRLVLLAAEPGDDLWRYRWEGKIQLVGANPYLLAPDAPALAALRDAEWTRINHRDYPAIYPPLAERMFRALAGLGIPVVGCQAFFALADLGVAGVLRSLLARARASPAQAVWYAWNPLAIYVSAGAAHFDSVMVLALVSALWLLDAGVRRREADGQSLALAAASASMLGAAIALKAAPAVLLPVWAVALGWRRAALTLPVAAAAPLGLAVTYGFPTVPVFGALGKFASDFRVNDALWWLLDPGGRAGALVGWLTGAVCVGLACWFWRDWRRATLWVFGAALLLSPSLHAWYLLWVLPLAVWRGAGARAWIVLSITIFGYFLLWEVNHAIDRPWQEPLWLRLGIYLPPLAFLIFWRRGSAPVGEAW